jgi:spoIIIJ-associated protein
VEAKSERRSVVASGKTVEDAIANGLTMLGLRRHQVDVEVLSEGSRGVLGFGAENAQVKILVKPPREPKPAPAPKPEPKPAPVSEQMSSEAPLSKGTPSPEAPPAEAPSEEAPAGDEPDTESSELLEGQVGEEILTDLLRLMGIPASVESKLGYELGEEGQPPPIVLNITGEDLGILIGRRGETLRSLQYLVRLMVSHRLKHWTNLIVDVEGYLVRRRRTLEELAQRMAERVASSGRAQALEPMPPYERRLVHIALRNHPEVGTQSVGEGDRRKVTIVPKQ